MDWLKRFGHEREVLGKLQKKVLTLHSWSDARVQVTAGMALP